MQSWSSAKPGSEGLTLWLGALPAETAPIRSLLEETTSVEVAGQVCWMGRAGESWLSVGACGVGAPRCGQTLAALMRSLNPDRVVLAGVAGGLDPDLQAGDVVVANRLASWPRHRRTPTGPDPVLGAVGDPGSLSAMAPRPSSATFRIVAGSILTWNDLVHDEASRRALRDCYGADCVDMETGYVARICAEQQLPFLAFRGISDAADTAIEDFERADWALAIWHATSAALAALR